MLTFKRHRSLKEIKVLCKKRDWRLLTAMHDKEGSDFITIEWVVGPNHGRILYSVFNGRFFGEEASLGTFSSDSDIESEEWFTELLKALYIS